MSNNDEEQMITEWFVRYRRTFNEDSTKPWAATIRSQAQAELKRRGFVVYFDPSKIEHPAIQQERAGV